jgi:hypothetical protein
MTVLWLGRDPIPDQWQSARQALARALSPDHAHHALDQHLPEFIAVARSNGRRSGCLYSLVTRGPRLLLLA